MEWKTNLKTSKGTENGLGCDVRGGSRDIERVGLVNAELNELNGCVGDREDEIGDRATDTRLEDESVQRADPGLDGTKAMRRSARREYDARVALAGALKDRQIGLDDGTREVGLVDRVNGAFIDRVRRGERPQEVGGVVLQLGSCRRVEENSESRAEPEEKPRHGRHSTCLDCGVFVLFSVSSIPR